MMAPDIFFDKVISQEERLEGQLRDLRWKLDIAERRVKELEEELKREIAFKEDYLWVIRRMREARIGKTTAEGEGV